MGRKSTFDRTIADQIIVCLGMGTPLTLICANEGFPCDDTVRNWGAADPAFGREIARARERGFDSLAVEAMSIADNKAEDPASRRVRVETRLKLLAKWDPKRYGDLLKLGGDERTPLIVQTGVPRADS